MSSIVKALVIVVMITTIACNPFRARQACEQYIDKEIMENLLKDVFLLEAYFNTQPHRIGLRDSIPYYYAGLFRRYNINAEQFEKALQCYMLDDAKMNALMDNILSSLSIAQSKLDQLEETASPREYTLEYFEYPHYY